MSKFTPGPWEWNKPSINYPATDLEPDVLQIYESHGGGSMPNEANAQLIAAAPDLLEELKRALEVFEAIATSTKPYGPIYRIARTSAGQVRALLARVTGD